MDKQRKITRKILEGKQNISEQSSENKASTIVKYLQSHTSTANDQGDSATQKIIALIWSGAKEWEIVEKGLWDVEIGSVLSWDDMSNHLIRKLDYNILDQAYQTTTGKVIVKKKEPKKVEPKEPTKARLDHKYSFFTPDGERKDIKALARKAYKELPTGFNYQTIGEAFNNALKHVGRKGDQWYIKTAYAPEYQVKSAHCCWEEMDDVLSDVEGAESIKQRNEKEREMIELVFPRNEYDSIWLGGLVVFVQPKGQAVIRTGWDAFGIALGNLQSNIIRRIVRLGREAKAFDDEYKEIHEKELQKELDKTKEYKMQHRELIDYSLDVLKQGDSEESREILNKIGYKKHKPENIVWDEHDRGIWASWENLFGEKKGPYLTRWSTIEALMFDKFEEFSL